MCRCNVAQPAVEVSLKFLRNSLSIIGIIAALWFGGNFLVEQFFVSWKYNVQIRAYAGLGVWGLANYGELGLQPERISRAGFPVWPQDGKSCLTVRRLVGAEPQCGDFEFPTESFQGTDVDYAACEPAQHGGFKSAYASYWIAAVEAIAELPEFSSARLNSDQISKLHSEKFQEETNPDTKWLTCAYSHFPPRLVKHTQCEGFTIYIYDVSKGDFPKECAGLHVSLE